MRTQVTDNQQKFCTVSDSAHGASAGDIQRATRPFISEEEMNRRLGITEDDLVGFEDVELE